MGRYWVVLRNLGHAGGVSSRSTGKHAKNHGEAPAYLQSIFRNSYPASRARVDTVAHHSPVLPDKLSYVYLLTSDLEERTALIAHLGQAGILAVFHYVPLHSSPYGQSLGGDVDALPVTEEVSARLLRLPLYYDMSEADVAAVGEAILEFYRVRAPEY